MHKISNCTAHAHNNKKYIIDPREKNLQLTVALMICSAFVVGALARYWAPFCRKTHKTEAQRTVSTRLDLSHLALFGLSYSLEAREQEHVNFVLLWRTMELFHGHNRKLAERGKKIYKLNLSTYIYIKKIKIYIMRGWIENIRIHQNQSKW